MKKFVYTTKEIKIDNNIKILKREIGILKDKNNTEAIIQFVNINEPITLLLTDIKEFDPTKTGDQYKYKVCNRCNRLLPVEQFSINQNGKNNRSVRRPSCDSCRKTIDGVNVKDSIKKIWLKEKPNMEIWECPICKKKTIPGLTSKVVLDHNHETGQPRAWICDSCNTGLGRFKDNIETIKNAIDYLNKK